MDVGLGPVPIVVVGMCVDGRTRPAAHVGGAAARGADGGTRKLAGPAFGKRSAERIVAGLWFRQRHRGLQSLRRRQGSDCPSIATSAAKGRRRSKKETGGGGGGNGGAAEKAETMK